MRERLRHSEAVTKLSQRMFVCLALAVGVGAAAYIYDNMYLYAAAGVLGTIGVLNGASLIDKKGQGPRS